MNFGSWLRRARENRMMSLRDLAPRIGITASYLSDLELGRRTSTNYPLLGSIAEALEVSMDEVCYAANRLPPDVQEYLTDLAEGRYDLEDTARAWDALRGARDTPYQDEPEGI